MNITMDAEIDEMVEKVCPAPNVVSDVALRQLRPLLVELVESRRQIEIMLRTEVILAEWGMPLGTAADRAEMIADARVVATAENVFVNGEGGEPLGLVGQTARSLA